MKFTANGVDYSLNTLKMTFAEGEAVERITGLSFAEVGPAIDQGNLKPMRAMMWVAAKRVNPTLTIEETESWEITSLDWSDIDEADIKKDTATPSLSSDSDI